MPPHRVLQRPASVVLGVLVALFLLESVLQALSWIQYRGLRRHYAAQVASAGGRPGERRVLCLGDSFTFGHGASAKEFAYPAQLQRLLSRGAPQRPWRVVNFGKRGANSGEVLYHLGGWIAMTRPSHVCLLIGNNDGWNTTYAKARPQAIKGCPYPDLALGDEPITGPVDDLPHNPESFDIWSNGPNQVNEWGFPESDDVTSWHDLR